MSFGLLFSREWKFTEAAGINKAASWLSAKADAVEAKVDAEMPQGVTAVIAAVEKADSVLGPLQAGLINMALSTYESQIEAELVKLLDEAAAFVPQVVTAMRNVATKLQAEAEATV